MKKFSQAIPALHEAEGAAKSELQKSYAEYFKAKLNKFGAKSPADLTPEQKTEFFNEITKDWNRGEGATKAGQADIEEHGVKESEEVNEGNEKLLKQANLSSSEYQTAKKLKGFDETKWKWDSSKDLYAKMNESDVNEGDMTKFYDGFIVLDQKNKKKYKFKYIKGTSNVKVEDEAIAKVMKATGLSRPNFGVHGFVNKGEWNKDDTPVLESQVNEAEIKSEAEFKEYAMALLKKAHPDDFDEAKANATIEGILKKCDGDFGACVGMITSALGESATNEGECPMCKCDPCNCYTNEGNAFGDAVKKAKEAGEKEFEFQGKTYKVEESEAGAPNDLNEGADVTPYLDEVKKALPQLEDLIKKKLGFAPKLTADKKGNDRIFIQSSDLMNELGKTLVKTLFTKIEIGFWGGNVTGDGKSIWFNPKIWYEHPSGGSNGCDFVWDSLWWDLNTKKWVEGRSLIK